MWWHDGMPSLPAALRTCSGARSVCEAITHTDMRASGISHPMYTCCWGRHSSTLGRQSHMHQRSSLHQSILTDTTLMMGGVWPHGCLNLGTKFLTIKTFLNFKITILSRLLGSSSLWSGTGALIQYLTYYRTEPLPYRQSTAPSSPVSCPPMQHLQGPGCVGAMQILLVPSFTLKVTFPLK